MGVGASQALPFSIAWLGATTGEGSLWHWGVLHIFGCFQWGRVACELLSVFFKLLFAVRTYSSPSIKERSIGAAHILG